MPSSSRHARQVCISIDCLAVLIALCHSQVTLISLLFAIGIMAPQVFFITGTSTGFGNEFVKKCLKEGDKVVATARNSSKLKFDGTTKDNYLAVDLDVTDQRSAFANAVTDDGRSQSPTAPSTRLSTPPSSTSVASTSCATMQAMASRENSNRSPRNNRADRWRSTSSVC